MTLFAFHVPRDDAQIRAASHLLGEKVNDPGMVLPPARVADLRPDDGDRMIVATVSDEVVGAIWAGRMHDQIDYHRTTGNESVARHMEQRYTEIYALAVSDTYVDEGVAAGLLEVLELTVRDTAAFIIEAVPDDDGIKIVYRKAGFEVSPPGATIAFDVPHVPTPGVPTVRVGIQQNSDVHCWAIKRV